MVATCFPSTQDRVQYESMQDAEQFWLRHAALLDWQHKPCKAINQSVKTLPSGASHLTHEYFANGFINTSYNCVDRHIEGGRADTTAIIYESPVSGTQKKISYRELLDEVEYLAAVLVDDCQVTKGDTVIIYMPMIPQAIYAMLASSRVGAVHAVVFGGFAATSLAQRIDSACPKAILTASCGLEGLHKVLSYRGLIESALGQASHKPMSVLIWDRPQRSWGPLSSGGVEKSWQSLVKDKQTRFRREKGIAVRSDDPLYIIYTSGTTGMPKGVVRHAGGHAVGLALSIRYMFGLQGPGDVMFCASDVGWVVGHSYIVYGPLLCGATTVLFEGKPVGTPDADTFWRIIDQNSVTTLFTAPTALRAIKRDDPENSFFKARGSRGGMRSLRAIFLAGERSEPSIVRTYQNLLDRYGSRNAQVVDNWWSSESGSPITGIAMRPAAGLDSTNNEHHRALRMKPGAAGKAMPGYDVRCVDDDGKELPSGTLGNIVLRVPLGPTALTTLFEDDERFYKSYMKKFDGYFDTGDAGIVDKDGFVSIMSRTDDVINVAAHRFSTGSIEQAITSHPMIAEGCVVGVPDQLKGQLPFAFVTLSTSPHPENAVPNETLLNDVNNIIREQIGSIATLGGMIQGRGMIPKTRSGKTLRRVLKQLLENATHGDFEKEIEVPATVEDQSVINIARAKVKEYFDKHGHKKHRSIEERSKI